MNRSFVRRWVGKVINSLDLIILPAREHKYENVVMLEH